MSALVRCKSKMTKKKYVKAALEQLKIAKQHITETANDGLQVSGQAYGQTWGSGIRFTKQTATDPYTVTYSSDDRRRIARQLGINDVAKEVHQWYDALVVQDTLTEQGFFPTIEKEGNQLKVIAQG